LAGLFVEGVKAVAAGPCAPQLAVMPRVMTKSLSTTGEAVRPLGKVSRPYSSIRNVPTALCRRGEAGENSLRVLDVNIARFGINRRAGGRIARVNGVAQKIQVKLLPQFLPGVGIEAGHPFRQIRPLPQVAHDINAPVAGHRRRLPGKIRRPERMAASRVEGRFFSEEVPFWFGPRQLNQPVGAALKWEWPRKKPRRLIQPEFQLHITSLHSTMATTILAANDARGSRAIIGFQEYAQYLHFGPSCNKNNTYTYYFK
jgi:hypothetical protein